MSRGHGAQGDVLAPLDGPIERLAPQCKLIGLIAFVVAVVLTPVGAWPAFAVDAAVVATLAVIALVPPSTLARRLLIELPFVALALAMIVAGETSAAATLLVRVGLALIAVSVLMSTTTPADVIVGFQRLHVPAPLTNVAAAAVRQLEVVRVDLDRLRIARAVRSGGRRQGVHALAGTGATLFVRSIERAERVHTAMVARGYTGANVGPGGRPARRLEWLVAATPALVAAIAGVVA